MTHQELSDILEEIGTLLELKGENPFKCRAYHNASRIIASSTIDLKELIEAKELTSLKGIGSGIAEVITELYTTGKSSVHDELKSSLPEGLLELLRIPGLGPKRVKILHATLHIANIPQLQEAAMNHRLANLTGFGEKIEKNVLEAIERLTSYAAKHLYSVAEESANKILRVLQDTRGVHLAEIAGSLRRKKEIIGDIDLLVSCDESKSAQIMNVFISHPEVEKVLGHGETKSSVLLKTGITCDLRIVRKEEYPFALSYFTGSKEHNVSLRTLAKQFGWSLNEYGFSKIDSKEKRGKAKRIVRCNNESDIYEALGLSYIPPELRENTGEIEAARKHALPDLIEEKDIKGTFHCHTSYSDGRNTLVEMVHAAMDLGWEYIGIADHSKIAAYANGLSLERVKLQHKEIDILNKKLKKCHIFKGTEVDILSDGSLDWSDKVLERFDYVVASIHSKFTMSEEEATRRLIKAIKNRHVTILGHPTGRLLLQRDGYPVNMKDVITAASDHGKMIEINADPQRLDLDWRYCRFAKEMGVKIAINPDAHTTRGLKNVHYGVGIARKGWLEKKDVINTKDVESVRAAFNN
jgi:DNA polymerase (family 10)